MKFLVRIALAVSFLLAYIPFSFRPALAASPCADSFDPAESGSFANPIDPRTLEGKIVEVVYYIGAPAGSDRDQKVQVEVNGACLWTWVGINIDFRPVELKNGLTYYASLWGDQIEYDLTFDQYTGRVSGYTGIWTVNPDPNYQPAHFVDIYEVTNPTGKDVEIESYWWPRFQKAFPDPGLTVYETKTSPWAHCYTIMEYFWATGWSEQNYRYLAGLCTGKSPNPDSLRYLQNVSGAGSTGLYYLYEREGMGIEAMTIKSMPENGRLAGYLTPCQLPKYLFLGYEVLVTRPTDMGQESPEHLLLHFYSIRTGKLYTYDVPPGTLIAVIPEHWDTSIEWYDQDFTVILPVSRIPIFKVTDCG